jgi:hypothetical protein
LLGIVVLVLGFAGPAAATVLWSSEQTMVDNDYLRSSFIYDVGAGHLISYGQFASPAVAAFYERNGFDANFMVWAPIVAIDRPNEFWTACDNNGGGLCPDSAVRTGNQTVAAEIGSGQIHVKLWNGAFIAAACGNWNHAGAGPVPRLSGVKYEDRNGDGGRGPDEPGLPGWTITLSYNGTPVAATTTGPDGSYQFALDATRLPIGAGTYSVAETPQPGWVQSQAPAPVTIDYGAGDALFGGNDFGNWRPATIAGRKFDDHAVDGGETGDPGLPGWGITLGSGATTTTGTDGGYAFTGLKPGTYTVAEQQQPGWRQTAPAGGTATVTLTSGQVLSGIDIGNVCLGTLTVTTPDTVAVTVDQVSVPGILANDPPLPRSATGTTTFADLLPGTYRVTLTLPDGVFTTDPDLTSLAGAFAIVKTVTVTECASTAVAPVFVTSGPGKITGGVRIGVPGGFATAGFEFMQGGNGPRGTLEFNDHASGVRIHTSDITGISVSGTDAYVFGHATIGATACSFRLHLQDAGEPGTSDRFELLLSNGYTAGSAELIDDGNIQIH